MASRHRPARSQSHLRRALGGAFSWVVVPAIAVVMLMAILPGSGVSLRVALGQGEAGVFTADQQLCAHNRNGTQCEWRGRFDGDDGIARQPVFLESDPRGWEPGTTDRVIWVSDEPDSVFHPRDPRALLLVIVVSMMAATTLVTWAVAALRRVRGRPTPRWIDRVHGFCGWPPTT